MNYIVVSLITLIFFSNDANAKLILNCKTEIETSVTWEENPGLFGKKGMKHTSKISESPIEITIVQDGKEAFLKGNIGQSDLIVINSDTYLEKTLSGVNLWKYMRTPSGEPYIVQMKAYESFGPTTYTNVYKCR